MFSRLGLFAVSLPWALTAQTEPPSPKELIARAKSAQQAQDDRAWKYTYREDSDESQIDKNGQPMTPRRKTYEHIMLEGAEYKKLVLIDGKSLDAKTQKKIDTDLEKERANRRKHGVLPRFHREFDSSDLDLVDRFFEKKVTGEETVLGRRTWRMESEPRPGTYKPANTKEQQALATRQIYWFDQQDGMEVKEHIEFIRAANGFQPGTTIAVEFGKIGDDWLTDNVTFRPNLKLAFGIGLREEVHSRFYDYKRFTVDSTFTPQ